ncbi:hypothetical protein F5X99DRAFT_387048 [Biscogniauxia marginata]|nr:hypothetical protein F5X99DRAFT_387048 [Biscogniauxia marginata]
MNRRWLNRALGGSSHSSQSPESALNHSTSDIKRDSHPLTGLCLVGIEPNAPSPSHWARHAPKTPALVLREPKGGGSLSKWPLAQLDDDSDTYTEPRNNYQSPQSDEFGVYIEGGATPNTRQLKDTVGKPPDRTGAENERAQKPTGVGAADFEKNGQAFTTGTWEHNSFRSHESHSVKKVPVDSLPPWIPVPETNQDSGGGSSRRIASPLGSRGISFKYDPETNSKYPTMDLKLPVVRGEYVEVLDHGRDVAAGFTIPDRIATRLNALVFKVHKQKQHQRSYHLVHTIAEDISDEKKLGRRRLNALVFKVHKQKQHQRSYHLVHTIAEDISDEKKLGRRRLCALVNNHPGPSNTAAEPEMSDNDLHCPFTPGGKRENQRSYLRKHLRTHKTLPLYK